MPRLQPHDRTAAKRGPRATLASTIIGLTLVMVAAVTAQAAELVMFEQAACPWCARFNSEIGPIYPKTEEGRQAPLRRVDIDKPLPADLAFVRVERLTPLFVLIDDGHEIGRIRGYPGDDNFWGLLDGLLRRLNNNGDKITQ